MARRLALSLLTVALVLLLSSPLWAVPISPEGASSVTVTVSGTGIGSFELTVSCDSAVAVFGDPSPGSIAGFTISAGKTGPGSVVISGVGSGTLDGTVATIPITMVGTVGSSTSIRGHGSFTDDLMGGYTVGTVSCSPNSFEVVRTLNIGASPSEGGTTSPPPGTHTFTSEGAVPISAIASPGWHFSGWTGGVADPNASTTMVTMDADKTVTASFSRQSSISYTLTMSVNPTGGGTTEPPAGSNTYGSDAVVDLRAIPAQGWKFVDWTGGVADPNSPNTTINLTDNKAVTANFSTDDSSLAVLSGPTGEEGGGGTSSLLLFGIIGAGLLGAATVAALVVRSRRRGFSGPSWIPEPGRPVPAALPAEPERPVPAALPPEPERPLPAASLTEAELDRVEYGLGSGILAVTGKAARRLREVIRSKTTDPASAIRIACSASAPTRLKMSIDSQRPDDMVLYSQNMMLLLLGPDVIKMLGGITVDYQESESGGTFAMSREGATSE